MTNYFTQFTWHDLIKKNPQKKYSVKEYHEILCPKEDYPNFLDKYIDLPLLQRLSGIGLLCGSDWTPLFNNRFYYSRLDHSIGVALIVWHFTHNKTQTLAGLLHDISTTVFSHVSDFRNGDALTQTSTEEPTERIIKSDKKLLDLLNKDNICVDDVIDYHKYPIADNEIPQLSADRLEYMFPSGMALEGSWELSDVKRIYNNITIYKNEENIDELGFKNLSIAEEYCRRFCITGHILQMNEDKITLHLLSQIMNKAVRLNVLQEEDFMCLSEKLLLEKLELGLIQKKDSKNSDLQYEKKLNELSRLYKTFRNMTKIIHTEEILPNDKFFSVNLKVKQRYINPLVADKSRLYDKSAFAKKLIDDFLSWNDTTFGYVELL